MKKSKQIIAFFVVVAFMLYTVVFPMQAKVEKKIVRVGYPIQAGLTEIDEDGNYSGYTYEYLQEIAQYANWEYEFVTLDKDINESLVEMMDMLEKGEIDLMGGMVYSESLSEKYDYAGRNYGNTNTVLKVLYDSDITNLNAASRTNLKVAARQGSTVRQKELNEFCDLYKITPTIIEFKDEEEGRALLKNGTVDAILDVSANQTEDLRTVASFAPRPFYFTTTKGRNDIISEINSAIDLIEQTDPYYTSNLYDKYFGGNSSMFLLTTTEEAFVENSDAIKVGVLLDKPPFQYIDENNGNIKGISIDVLDYISDKTGLNFELVVANKQEELDELINKNEVDVISFFITDYSLARDSDVALTRSYMKTQSYAVMKKGAEQKNLEDKKYVYYPDQLNNKDIKSILKVDSLEDALKKIDKNKADYTLGNGYSLQYYVNHSEYNNLVLLPVSSEDYGIGFGITKPVNKDLLSIFNKSILNLSDSELQNIIYPNTTYNREFSIEEWVRLNPFTAITISVIVMAIIIIFLVRWLRMQKQMNEKISVDLEKRLQIYELSNDYFFEYNEKEKVLISSLNDKGEAELITYPLYQLDISKYTKDAIDMIHLFVDEIKTMPEGTKELELISNAKGSYWISITVKKIYDQNGKLAHIIGKIKNIQEEKNKERNLIRKAELDGLTKVYNAETYRRKVEESLDKMATEEKGVFLLIDADDFKGVNDSFGHLKGDKTLIHIGNILLEEVDNGGICGRIGGDEFALFNNQIKNYDDIKIICERIIDKANAYKLDDAQHLSLSIGAVYFEGKAEYNILYRTSDEALYKVKESGRNNYLILQNK